MSDELELFEPPPRVEVPDPFDGKGRDAQKTVRDLMLIDQGFNPGTRLRLHKQAAAGRSGLGLRCRECVFLYRTGAGNKDFLKCKKAGVWNSRGSWGPDMRAWWPACQLFEEKPS